MAVDVTQLGRTSSEDLELTVAEASRLCRISQDALRRQLRAGRLPRARRLPGGCRAAWVIPVSELVSALLCSPGDAALAGDLAAPDAHLLRYELAQREAQLAEARLRLEAAEVRLGELGAALEHQRRVELVRAQAPIVVIRDSDVDGVGS